MSVITDVPEPNLWEEICKEISQQRRPCDEDDDRESTLTDYIDYDAAKHNPVFYGKMFAKVTADDDVTANFSPADSHPSCIGFSFTKKPERKVSIQPTILPNRTTCTPTEYLNHYVFPWLLPALEAMLKQAKLEKCFEKEESVEDNRQRRRTKFNACDFITEYLYKNNPSPQDENRRDIELWDIPFVKEWLKDHPRPPLPMSLIWTDEEAALIIQSFWRGYLVRKEPEVQELRVWQREWREENRGIQNRVSEFWEKQMPDGDEPAPDSSEQKTDEIKDENNTVESPTPCAS